MRNLAHEQFLTGTAEDASALSWLLEMILSKDLEHMLTLRDAELISRIATSLRTDVAESNVRRG